MFDLITEYNIGYMLLCITTGIGLSYLLYSIKPFWSKKWNILLFVMRAIFISFLCFLLLRPLLRHIKNNTEKPTLVFLFDDSRSITLASDSNSIYNILDKLEDITDKLTDAGYQIRKMTLNKDEPIKYVSDISFSGNLTPISDKLRYIETNYEHYNFAGIVLISDGIFNNGISPEYYQYRKPIYTLGLGDTMPARDIYIKSIYANKIAYLNNTFPLVAEIHHNGFEKKNIQVNLYHKDNLLEKKSIVLAKDHHVIPVKFLVAATDTGIQNYKIIAQNVEEELTHQNNHKNVYIDIINGKENILLIATSPHPDIKALKYAIEKNENYKLTIHIPGITDTKDSFQYTNRYDLAIIHQIPYKTTKSRTYVDQIITHNTPIWYILSERSDINYFNTINNISTINIISKSTDEALASFNDDLQYFTFDEEKRAIIHKFPPIAVPFADYRLSGKHNIVLYQQIGNIPTNKPLLVIGEQHNKKEAVMTGIGFWKWRLQDISSNTNKAFDALINKIVQYLCTREDKRKFRVYPLTYEYNESESVILKTELYNNIYEQISGQKISLIVSNEKNKKYLFEYINVTKDFQYRLPNLPKGIYKFITKTQLDDKILESRGRFVIKNKEIESVNTQANFPLLQNVSAESGGNFYLPEDIEKLYNNLLDDRPPNIIYSTEQLSEIIDLSWLMIVLIIGISVEWSIRKIKGGY